MSDEEYEDFSDSGAEEKEEEVNERRGHSRTVPKIAVDDNDVDDEEKKGAGKMKFKDRASFREQSAAFQDVLSKSSKFRHRDGIPEPGGRSPRRLEGLTPRDPDDDFDSPRSPRSPRSHGERHLVRGQLGQRDPDDERRHMNSNDHRPRVVDLDDPSDISPALRRNTDKMDMPWMSGRAPVRGGDRLKLNDIETHSPRPGEMTARIRLSADESRSAPNSPRLSGKSPMLGRKDKISLDDATSSLRQSRQGRLAPLGK